MKEMIQELQIEYKNLCRDVEIGGPKRCIGLMRMILRSIIAVMERLDAMEHGKVQLEVIDHKIADIQRAAKIDALRWAANNATCGHTLCSGMRVIADEVRRLENGGES